MSLPRPVAPLGQSIRDLEWLDGVLYGAVGPVVQAFRMSESGMEVIATSAPLPGLVMDVAAGNGVVYAAYIDPWEWEGAEIGGLTVLTPVGGAEALRVAGGMRLGPRQGYEGLALDGATMAARRCAVTGRREGVCDTLDVLDVGAPLGPQMRSSISIRPLTQFESPGVAALGSGLFTDGRSVIDASDPSVPVAVAELAAPGRPSARGDLLLTVGDDAANVYSLNDALPRLLGTFAIESLGLPFGVTAEVVLDDGILVTGGESSGGRSPGNWAFIPVVGDRPGTPVTGASDRVTTAIAAGQGATWHAMSRADFRIDLGDGTMSPYTASIGRLSVNAQGVPAGNIQTEWTGWSWRTADVETVGDLVYTLTAADDHVSDRAPLSLLVYDTSNPLGPRLVGRLDEVCEPSSAGLPLGRYPIEDCSLTASSPGRLLVSGARGAMVIDVSDASRPSVLLRGPSLGAQLTNTPFGVLGLHDVTKPHPVLLELSLYDASGSGWPVERWTTAVMADALKLVVSQHGAASLAALIGWGESGPVSLWTGWLSEQAPPEWSRLADPGTGVPWAPHSLAAAGDRLYLARAYETARSAQLAQGGQTLENYRVTGTGIVFEGSIPLPDRGSSFGAAMIGDMLLLQDEHFLDFVAVGGDSEPRVLGSAAYGGGSVSDETWQDVAEVPRIVQMGPEHFYVTAHVNAEVWEIP